MAKKVFASGIFDMLNGGHIDFLKQASEYGDLHVGVASDKTIELCNCHKPVYPQEERLWMVQSVRYVKEAWINSGVGVMDFVDELENLKPDVFVVSESESTSEKEELCKRLGIEYIVLKRVPTPINVSRSSEETSIPGCLLPTRLDLAGAWMDQPYVSCISPGCVLTISLEPTFDIRDRSGMSTSTRKAISKIWPVRLPDMDPETLARVSFCFENNPEKGGNISGAQDSIGICIPGLCRHYYNNAYWPERIETCYDEEILCWLENHLCMITLEPRPKGAGVAKEKHISPEKVLALAKAADDCWNAIMNKDLDGFVAAYLASFNAQISMFPRMVQGCVQPAIDKYSVMEGVMAWKMPGAGGGGYLALVVKDTDEFTAANPEAFRLHIRRKPTYMEIEK